MAAVIHYIARANVTVIFCIIEQNTCVILSFCSRSWLDVYMYSYMHIINACVCKCTHMHRYIASIRLLNFSALKHLTVQHY